MYFWKPLAALCIVCKMHRIVLEVFSQYTVSPRVVAVGFVALSLHYSTDRQTVRQADNTFLSHDAAIAKTLGLVVRILPDQF